MSDKAVLFLIFNRPDTAEEVMRTLQLAKPPRLYIAADGPRAQKTGEAALCKETRACVLEMINWECEIHTLFQDNNLGCAKAVGGAITWFFDHEEMGIILEDDCSPHQSFFTFCSSMLNYFKDDERVMHIAGFKDSDDGSQDVSYFFSYYPRIWGWATWRRAWNHYTLSPPKPTEAQKSMIIKTSFYGHRNAGERWFSDFARSYAKLSSWDYQWCLAIWMQHGLSVNSSVPLVKNIGFDGRGTHTTDADTATDLTSLQLGEFVLPVVHPASSMPDSSQDIKSFRRHLDPPLTMRARLKWNAIVKRMIK